MDERYRSDRRNKSAHPVARGVPTEFIVVAVVNRVAVKENTRKMKMLKLKCLNENCFRTAHNRSFP